MRTQQDGPRIRREKRTVSVMISVYCRAKHTDRPRIAINADQNKNAMCEECKQLYLYAQKRLSYCRFGEQKTTCGKCLVHCYKPEMRDRIRQVMRYAGSRMVWKQPLLTIRHAIDGMRPAQVKRKDNHSSR
ncbi:nitrous oxide-stimulated promoter family protein [Paenibacillus apiarius]|uniref:Nitrous oxide-stimulated promoter family protein n=1 Tax=Paenibacillus apiarius TaxID=46240 RepID=A0ABT4E169_9BACL|nr:nitrous oxide-stimulated promoter family protein [Paenibacillus apiarius]MCY9514944.1 nitrous oxide-stimulated promoter family protein [Paenibacillus apiarius]MCY9523360.1 nitrous oxide-stimulated promoter family protein [Paenibacillus apiarius]MCY9554188.1 nitrous oxide-stimulated promoter family protein [Paenibacillus apiarius]MCY9559402.1 nitrous oxide-stimulated promoter family protein [Paenibacillus apiarius]MCY9686827.1 nitrous oxide-stimulated promoter family protein [Paenibacillus a